MAEFEPQVHSPEHSRDKVENSVEQKEKLQHLLEQAKEAHHKPAEHAEHLKHAAQREALSGKDIQGKIGEKEHQAPSNYAITKATKKASYKKTLRHVQRQLPKRERAFSKVIHQPVVEKVSEVGSKTVARPSGILAGGICALVGSSTVLYLAKHYGFRYNFFVFILFMIVGFGVGLILELLWSSTKKLRGH